MSWEPITLGEAATLLVGFAFKSSAFLDANDEGVRLLRGDNVQQGYIRWGDKTKRWPYNEYDDFDKYQLQRGDVILAMDRPIVGDGLKFAWITDEDLPALLVQRVCCIRGKADRALTGFLRYVVADPRFSAHIHKITTGANIPHISGKDIASYEFLLPEKDEQEVITSVLSAYDDLIAANQRRIQLLEESAQLLYREWFIKLRFPGHETVPVTDGVPEGWSYEKLEAAFLLQRGFDLPASERIVGDIPVYASTGVAGFHNHAKVSGPGIVTGRSGTLGEVHFVHDDFWPLNTTLWVKEFKKATPLLAYFILGALDLVVYNSGASVPTLDRKTVHAIDILIPESQVQRRFELAIMPFFDQIRAITLHNEKLRQARDMLLPKLMSGALDVSRITIPKEIEA